jgi:hypothetical protein
MGASSTSYHYSDEPLEKASNVPVAGDAVEAMPRIAMCLSSASSTYMRESSLT